MAKLSKKTQATRTNILCWRVEQGTVIGKGDIVQIIFVIINIKGAPAAIG